MATVSSSAASGRAPPAGPGKTAAGSATGAASGESLAVATWAESAERESKSDRYLARRLAAAGADFKGVALTIFLLAAAIGVMLWLACGILLEHWLVAGGLPRWFRIAWLTTGVAALAAAVVRWIVPLVRYKVNLVYAARTIERGHPDLHNDLVNAVLVKAHPEGSTPLVVRSLERRAARRLSRLPSEGVVDRSIAVRLALGLATLVGLACLYELLAPKSLLVTAARLVAPWAGIAAPSRVRIESMRLEWRMPDEPPEEQGDDGRRRIPVESGQATLVRGRQLIVAGAIRGLRDGERPTVTVTPLADVVGGSPRPAEGTEPSWRVEMQRNRLAGGTGDPSAAEQPVGPGRRAPFVAVLPDPGRGLDQSVEIVVVAGDARSEPVRIAVVDSPSLLVREVRYEYPPYTRREMDVTQWQGDLRAVEGTRVTIVAESNQPLESAWIDFGCNGSRDLRLKVGSSDLARASGSFVLAMNAGRTGAEHASYRLAFQPRGGTPAAAQQVVEEKLEHRIEVVGDLAPEVSIEEPRESPLGVPPDAPLTIRVRALDPDFGLARVGLETRVQGSAGNPEIVLLDGEQGGGHAGVFVGGGRLVPDQVGAGAGTVLEYRGVAVDNRPKEPNVSYSPWQSLRVDAGASPRPPDPAASPPSAADGQGEADASGGVPSEDSAAGNEQRNDTAGRDSAAATDDPREQERREQSGGEQSGGQEARGQGAGANQGGRQQQVGDRQDQPGSSTAGGRQQAGGSEDGSSEMEKKQPAAQQGSAKQGGEAGPAEGSKQGSRQPVGGAGSVQRPGAEPGAGDRPDQGAQAAGGNSGGREPGRERGDGSDGSRQRQPGGSAGSDPSNSNPSNTRANDAPANNGDAKPAGQRGGRGDGRGDQRREGDGSRSQSGGRRPRESVAADGTDDGEAMERILEHRRQAGGEPASEKKEGSGSGRPQHVGDEPGKAGKSGSDDTRSRDERNGDGQKGGDGQNERPKDGQTDGSKDGAAGEPQEGKETSQGDHPTAGTSANPNAGDRPDRSDADAEAAKDGAGQSAADRQSETARSNDPAGAAGPREASGQSPPCAGADGKPCGKAGCSSCGGGQQGGGGQAGGGGQPAGGRENGGQKNGSENQAGGDQKATDAAPDSNSGGSQRGGSPAGGDPGDRQQEAAQGHGEQGSAEQGRGAQGGNKDGGGERGDQKESAGQGEGALGSGGQRPGEHGQRPAGAGGAGGDRGGESPGADPGAERSGGRSGAGGQGAAGERKDGEGQAATRGDDKGDDEKNGPATAPGGGRSGIPSAAGSGGWSDGERPGPAGGEPPAGPPRTKETDWGEQDLAHARNAADLAIEHLRSAVDSGRTDVLDQLGWTREQARAFLERWESMRRLAEGGDPARRADFERAVRSLGLRPGGVRTSRDVPADVKGGQAEGRRSRPPSDYREQFKAYTQGTSGE